MPACLQLGRCVEIWSKADVVLDPRAAATLGPIMSARDRFAAARSRWLAAQGIDPGGREGFHLIPAGAPWSIQVSLVVSGDQDPREVAAVRFAAAGLGLDEVYEARDEAGVWSKAADTSPVIPTPERTRTWPSR